MAKIKHIAIATKDPTETANFFREVFDLHVVGKVDNDIAEGYYLSDGSINLAVMRFKDDAVAREELGTLHSGIHHIGFQVDDMAAVDAKLRKANSRPLSKVNAAIESKVGNGHGGRNVELSYRGPDGVVIDISQGGWVGTGAA